MATVMEEVFSKLPLPPFVLTLSKLFLNKNKWICFRNASSHSHLAYSLAPIWIFSFLTGKLNIFPRGKTEN